MWALLCERLVISKYSFDFKIISCTVVQHSTYVRYRLRWKTKLKYIEIKLTNHLHIGPACAKGLERKNEGTAVQGEILRNSGLKGR